VLAFAICAGQPRLFLFLQLPGQVRQLDSDFSGFGALVTALSAGAIHGLLQRIGGQDAKRDWHAGIQADSLEAIRGAAGDVVEMRSIAAHHCSQGHDCITVWNQMFGDDWQFPGARDLHKMNVFRRAPMLFEDFERALGKLFGNEFIEAAHDHAYAQAARVQ